MPVDDAPLLVVGDRTLFGRSFFRGSNRWWLHLKTLFGNSIRHGLGLWSCDPGKAWGVRS